MLNYNQKQTKTI